MPSSSFVEVEVGFGVEVISVKVIAASFFFCQTPVLGLGLGVDFTLVWGNHNNYNNHNHNNHNHKKDNNPHLNFVKGTVLGDKEQGIRDNG